MAFFSYLTVKPHIFDGHLTNHPSRARRLPSLTRAGSGRSKGGAMTSDASILSSQEMGERFDLLATNTREYAVFLVGLEGQLLCWNAGAERLFGYQAHEVMGRHFSRF